MFTPKIYKCKCHVCGAEFDYEAEFLHSPISLLGSDGDPRVGRSCEKHSAEEIRAAWLAL